MAIIKPIQYQGFTPYWWEVKEAREDRLNNTTTAILCLFADPFISKNDPNGYIPGYFPSCTIQGLGLNNDQIITAFLQQQSNIDDWKDATNTDNSYNLIEVKSPVSLQISNDIKTNVIRFATLVDYKHFCENNIIVMNIRIVFDTITDPINTDPTKFVEDKSRTQIIPWVVDDFNKIPNTTPPIGESDYFLSQVPTTFWEIFLAGIQYGDANGSINKKLK
jgi:hypothetical protein